MAIGSSLGITLPTQGGNTGTWGTDLNTELQKVIDAVEAQVPASAIDFSADFDLNGYSITSVEGVSFDQQASYAALNSIYFDTAGELYVRDGSNNAIQMTASGALNTASNGGVGDSGGDYGTTGIVFDWDGTIYNAKNGSGSDAYANIRMDELQLRDGSGNDLTVAVPAMSSNYTLTLPAAVPGTSGTFLQSDTSGTISYSNSTAQSITLTGSAEYKHAGETLIVSNSAGFGSNTTGGFEGWAVASSTYSGYWESSAAGDYFIYPINLNSGDRIDSILITYYGNTSLSRDFMLESFFYSTSTLTTHDTANETASGEQTIVLTPSPTFLINSSTSHYWLKFDCANSGDRAYHIQVTYSRP